MKSKIVQVIPVVLVLTAIGFRYFSLWCIFTTQICYGTTVSNISLTVTKPLYLFSLYLLPIAIILVFIPRSVFNSWLKFAAWALPLSFLYIASTEVSSARMGIDFFPFYRDDAARLAGQIFTGVSLALVAIKASIPSLRLFYERRYAENADAEIRAQLLLLVSAIGLVCLVVPICLLTWGSVSSPVDILGISIALALVSFLANVNAFSRAFSMFCREQSGVLARAFWYAGATFSALLAVAVAIFIFLYSNNLLDTVFASVLGAAIPIAFVAQALFFFSGTLTEVIKKKRGRSTAEWKGIFGLVLLAVSAAVMAIAMLMLRYAH